MFTCSALSSQGHGTCEDTLIRVLVSRSEIDLKKIVEEYRAMFNVSLQEHILVRRHKLTKVKKLNLTVCFSSPHFVCFTE